MVMARRGALEQAVEVRHRNRKEDERKEDERKAAERKIAEPKSRDQAVVAKLEALFPGELAKSTASLTVGQFDEAIKIYRRLLGKLARRQMSEDAPLRAKLFYHLAEALRLEGDYRPSVQAFRKHMRIVSEEGEGHDQNS